MLRGSLAIAQAQMRKTREVQDVGLGVGAWGVFALRVLGSRVLGFNFRVLGFWGLGFKGLGFRGDMHSPGVIRSLGLGGLIRLHAFVYVHEDAHFGS